eukprot:444934-Amphidinium_carterae.1
MQHGPCTGAQGSLFLQTYATVTLINLTGARQAPRVLSEISCNNSKLRRGSILVRIRLKSAKSQVFRLQMQHQEVQWHLCFAENS